MIPINSKPALIDQVYAQIKQAIITGDLLPLAPLAQEALAAQLGVSRQPVSHALMLLEKDGLVVEKGRKGRMWPRWTIINCWDCIRCAAS